MNEASPDVIWKIIHSYFEDNPQCLVRHHTESYNDFFKNGIFQIFKEKNPIRIQTKYDESIDDFRSKCMLYLGGKDGTKIYFGKPVIYDDTESHYMFPNEARLRNMTYGMTIHYDIEVEFIDILKDGEVPIMLGGDSIEEQVGGYVYEEKQVNFKKQTMAELTELDFDGGSGKGAPKKRRVKKSDIDRSPTELAIIREMTEKSMVAPNTQKRTIVLEKVFLGKFPIMVQSDYCVLSGLPKEVRHTMGECRNDVGGYFIIDGKEKTVVAQEKFGDNMLYIREVADDKYLYSAEIRSVSENVSKPIRTLSVKMVAPTSKYTFKNLVVSIPNVRKPVPLFIVFRALGVISDKQIITTCLLDIEKYESMVDLFIPSVYDAGGFLTQHSALKYIATLTKGKTIPHVLEILSDYFLPHVGEINFTQKAYYLGYIVFRLLSVFTGLEPPTDRDNFKYKRIELVGSLMYDLFREYYTIQQRQVYLAFEEKIYYNQALYADNLYGLIQENFKEVFRERVVEAGFKKAFKGNWGAQSHTKRIGVVQDLNRLSFNSALSHLRKTNLPLDASVKLIGPRVLHNTQWGMFDPIDTPDGGNIGIHKHLSISTYVSQGVSREPMIRWLREKIEGIKLVEDCHPAELSRLSKIIINGYWMGAVEYPVETVQKIKLFRRNALIPIYTSVNFEPKNNTIFIYTDAGRLCRPIFYRDDGEAGKPGNMSYVNGNGLEKIEEGKFSWADLITGFNRRKDPSFQANKYKFYELSELYEGIDVESNPAKLKRFLENKAMIDYIDTSESENALIAMNSSALTTSHTHLEIHESLILGVMCNLINFPENNPATRNSFSCGQSKQACSLYHTNHQVRMDKTAVVLMSGQTPLVKSRYLEYINNEENPYGENAIVAIMCYTGYNVEDAMLINAGSLKRGLFRTTYYSTYETHEEKTTGGDGTIEKLFTNIESDETVRGTKPGYDYSKLDRFGLIRENAEVDEKTVLIGLTASSSGSKGVKQDMSKTPKKGQLGIVDKSFITDGEEGNRIAKIRVREVRIPNLGDKMASRAGQKGTIGMVIPEADMPFTKDGIRPDIIINPHAIPSRMTIGQLVETITGKACAMYGGAGDCTAFINNGSKLGVFGEMLSNVNYHSSGNEILYNGMTGEQMEAEIFMGPTYYMRLKHMVKDKVNFRALGPRTALTRQPVSGRANDGGLRIGEMERDSLISHGTSEFLRESMMERGDKYFMAVCNVTGMVAVYNPSKNLFMSPMADGPLKFIGSLDGTDMNVENMSRFGRSFRVVCVPYSLKLLMQELATMNNHMRIITEDNIQQLENMMYSNNIQKLMFDEEMTPEKLVDGIKKQLVKIEKEKAAGLGTPESLAEVINYPNDVSPAYQPSELESQGSASYNPNESLENEPTSPNTAPVFEPTSPNTPPPEGTMLYAPESPLTPPTTAELAAQGIYREEGEMVGGGQDHIMMGGSVHLRGDSIPERLWKIRNIGPQFITIDTDMLQGLDIQDSIRVVSPIDIYKVMRTVMHGGATSVLPAQPPPVHSFQDGGYSGQSAGNPAISFNPVFKIMNGGSDFSTDPTSGPSRLTENESVDSNISQPVQFGGAKVEGLAPANESGKIDFANLVIRKL